MSRKRSSKPQITGRQTRGHDCWPSNQREPEDAFWLSLKEIGREHEMTPSDLIADIDSKRQYGNLSSVVRLFVLDFYRQQIPQQAPR
jgi:predicted DNA-binding ribbon-helix-helix protein